MIDIHSHCLPGVDDGAKNVAESIDILVDSYKQGVEICVCTPHAKVHRDSDVSFFVDKRNKATELLENTVSENQVSVPKLYYGFEVFIDNDISVYKDIEKLCIEDTNYMLVELSVMRYNDKYSEWLYSLSLKNIVPIIAHVERYPYFDKLMRELDGVKVAYQINASTLLKAKGRRLLNKLYESDCNVVCGSDMHNMLFRRSRMKNAFEKVARIDSDMANDVFYNNSKAIFK